MSAKWLIVRDRTGLVAGWLGHVYLTMLTFNNQDLEFVVLCCSDLGLT